MARTYDIDTTQNFVVGKKALDILSNPIKSDIKLRPAEPLTRNFVERGFSKISFEPFDYSTSRDIMPIGKPPRPGASTAKQVAYTYQIVGQPQISYTYKLDTPDYIVVPRSTASGMEIVKINFKKQTIEPIITLSKSVSTPSRPSATQIWSQTTPQTTPSGGDMAVNTERQTLFLKQLTKQVVGVKIKVKPESVPVPKQVFMPLVSSQQGAGRQKTTSDSIKSTRAYKVRDTVLDSSKFSKLGTVSTQGSESMERLRREVIFDSRLRSDVRSMSAQKVSPISKSAYISKSGLLPASITASLPAVIPASISGSALDSMQALRPVSIQRQILKMPDRPYRDTPIKKTDTPKPPRLPKFRFQFGGTQSSAFDVLSRRSGKWEVIGRGLPRGRALKVGSEYATRTLAASFKIIPSKTSGLANMEDIAFEPSASAFRNFRIKGGKPVYEPGLFIQRRGKRLSAGSEVKEIQAAKLRAIRPRWRI